MDANNLIDIIDDVVFVDKKNRYNITMIYNYKSDIKWDESWTKKTKILDKSDWRLPTLSELKWICKQKGLLSSLKPKYKHVGSTTLECRWIWSKTEVGTDSAFMVCGNKPDVLIKNKWTYADVIYIR